MDFKFTEEQQALRDTLQRFVRKDYDFEKRRGILKSGDGLSRTIWKQLADVGVLGIGIPEANGGYGGNAIDTLVVMEELGRGLVVEPYLSTVVIGAGLIARNGTNAQKSELLPKVVSGDCLLALAHFEPGGRYDLNRVTARAQKDGAGYRLSGSKTVVLHGATADKLIVSARIPGSVETGAGVSLLLVDRKLSGVSVQDYPTQDGQHAAEIAFKDVKLGADALLGREGQGLALVERAIESGIAALCAEALGAMTALQETTLQYLKTRKQFGMPIGAFQVLQHRAADMLIHVEQARSMAYYAAVKVESDDAGERRHALSAAKALVGQSARFVGQQAVQLHGGIGVTDELAVSHYFKRLTTINATFGDADHHLGRFSDLILDESRSQDMASAQARRA